MSHIVDFSVVGLAGRDGTFAATLNRDVNVFFGLNGSGKTSLLRILHSAMSNDSSLLINVPFRSATVTIYSISHECEFHYSISADEIAVTDEPERYLFEEMGSGVVTKRMMRHLHNRRTAPGWVVQPKVDGPTRWQHRFLPATRLLYRSRTAMNEAMTSDEGFDLHFERTLQEHWSEFFGEIQAGVRQSQQQGLADILNAVLNMEGLKDTEGSLDAAVAYDHIVSFLQRQNTRATVPIRDAFMRRFRENALLRNVVGRIHRVEREIEAAMRPRTQLDGLVQRLFSGNKSLTFGATSIDVVAEDKTNIGLRSLSSGEKHMLRILLETVQAGDSSLLIDEPEMSLHLDWQRSLIAAMHELNSRAQLILATHSPEVMADVDDAKIFELRI